MLEIFQWLGEDASREVARRPGARAVRDELTDVLIYFVRLADVLGVDLNRALANKSPANALRYLRRAGARQLVKAPPR